MPDIANLPVGLQSATLAEGPGANVGDKLGGAGLAFGDLVKQVGMSVAETQRRLNETCAATANSLASTTVDVIAVQATEYYENGAVKENKNITMPLPLVNFVDPVNYEMANVHLQGVFYASEFKAANVNTTDSSRFGGSASLHLGGFLGSPSAGSGVAAAGAAAASGSGGSYNYASQGSSHTEVSSGSKHSYEFGQVRMNAEMIPRDDIGVPKPNHIVRGPSLLMVPQELVTVPATPSAEHPLRERYTVVKITYRRQPRAASPGGAPIEGASFAIETGGLPWNYCNPAGVVDDSPESTFKETDRNGVLYFKVRRVFTAGEDTTPRSFALSARIGLVASSVPVNL
jgi:hypothetical protein